MHPDPLPIAIIGLDTSHSVEYPRRMQAPDCPDGQRVEGLRAVSCLRFPSAFQAEAGQDDRQRQLEAWGVAVTTDPEAALDGVAGVMLEINDPALHLPWFERVAGRGLPVYIDKPLAGSIRAGAEIRRLAAANGLRISSASPLRSDAALVRACAAVSAPVHMSVYGPLGIAPAGSSVVWYGVHAFEMLQRGMGMGSVAVTARRDASGVVAIVDYGDRRRGVVELNEGMWRYGGTLRSPEGVESFAVDPALLYTAHLREVSRFLRGGEPPASIDDAIEVMAMLDACDRSVQSGRTEPVHR